MPQTPLTITAADADLLRSMVAFLQEKNIYDAIPPILLSSNIGFLDCSLERYPELMSLQKLVLNGTFEDAMAFVAAYRASAKIDSHSLRQAEIALLRQKYLEAIFKYGDGGQPLYSIPQVASALERKGKSLSDDNGDNADVLDIVKTLEKLEKRCDATDFNSLCLCLTLSTFEDNVEYATWSVCKGRLDTLSEVCNALRLASTCRDEEGSVSKLAEYVSRGLAARDQTTAKETDNELGIRQQPSDDTAELEIGKYVESITIPIIMDEEDITVNELPSVRSIFTADTHRTHGSGNRSVFLTETPEPMPPPINLSDRDGQPIPLSDFTADDVGFARSSVPPPPPSEATDTTATITRKAGKLLSSDAKSSLAPGSLVRLPGGGYMTMDVKPHEPAGVKTHAFKDGEKKQAVAWTLELDDGTTNRRPKPKLPSHKQEEDPPGRTWKDSKPTTTTAAAAGGTGGNSQKKVDKYEEDDIRREEERIQAKKGATIRITTEPAPRPAARGSKIPSVKSLAQIKQEGRKKVVAISNAEQVINKINNEKPKRPSSAQSTSSRSNREQQRAVQPPLPAESEFEDPPPPATTSTSVTNDGDDDNISLQPSIKSGINTLRSSAELDSITNSKMVIEGKVKLSTATATNAPSIRISTDLEDVHGSQRYDVQSPQLPLIERSPAPVCLMEMECPVRAVKRIPLSNAHGEDRDMVVVFGTNQKSLKMGKFSELHGEFLLLQEWDNSHNGSVYCLDVLGKLGKSETCLIATGSNDKSIRIFRADTGEVSAPIKGHNGTIRCMKFCRINPSKSSQLLASVGSGDCCPRVWELSSGGGCKVLDPHPSTIHACVWISREVLATGCENGVVIIHDLLIFDQDESSSAVKSIQTPSSQPVFSLGYIGITNKVGLLVVGCGKGYMHIILIKQKGPRNVESKIVCSRVAHEDDIRNVHIHTVDNQEEGLQYCLLTTSFDQTSNLWNLEYNDVDDSVRCSVISTLSGHSDKVLCGDLFSWSGDNNVIAGLSSGADGKVCYWPLVKKNVIT